MIELPTWLVWTMIVLYMWALLSHLSRLATVDYRLMKAQKRSTDAISAFLCVVFLTMFLHYAL